SCSVKSNQISTFDGAKISANLDPCYRLLVGQCTESKSFAIFVRKISSESAKMEVKIILPEDEINLVPGQQLMVEDYINGDPIKNSAYQKISTKNNTIE
uniref:VWFD domain-containing protein n=1 Tax=Romanomermis culicivorax TaxID=13658 RepID=A0A915HL69_ROMCU